MLLDSGKNLAKTKKGYNKMDKFVTIMMTLAMLVVLSGGYMLYRNHWVYDTRTEILDYDMDLYDTLPSYGDMMYDDLLSFNIEEMMKKNEEKKKLIAEKYKHLKEIL